MMHAYRALGAAASILLAAACSDGSNPASVVEPPLPPDPPEGPTGPEAPSEPYRNPFLAASTWPIFHANTYATASSAVAGPGRVETARVIDALTGQTDRAPYVSPWTVFGEVYPDGWQPAFTTPNDGVAKYILNGEHFERVDFLPLDRDAFDFDWGILLLRGGGGVVTERRTNRFVVFGDVSEGFASSPIEVKRRIDVDRGVHGSLLAHHSLAPDGTLIALTDANRLIAVDLEAGTVVAAYDLPSDSGASFQNSFPIDEDGRIIVAAQGLTVAVDWLGGAFAPAWQAAYDMRGPGCEDVPTDRSRAEEIRAVANGETCTGTGTTPSLIGDPGTGVAVIVDGHSPQNNLVAFWRGEPPADWTALPDPT